MRFLADENVPFPIVNAVHHRTDWVGHFASIEPHRIRMRSLPSSKKPAAQSTETPSPTNDLRDHRVYYLQM